MSETNPTGHIKISSLDRLQLSEIKDGDKLRTRLTMVGTESFLNSINYLFSNKIEPNVRDFMLNPQYGSIKADNASGFLKGDIVKDAAQFGVKIKGAQPMSYMEVIKYAQELLEASDVETYLKELQIKLESEGEQNMVKPLANFAQESYEVLLKDMQSRLDKIGSDFSGNGVLIAKF